VDCHGAVWLAAIVLYCQTEYIILNWKEKRGLIAGFREKVRGTFISGGPMVNLLDGNQELL